MIIAKLCRDVFFASNKTFPVYLNSVKNEVGYCEVNGNNLEINIFDGSNLRDGKYAYIITPNPHGLPQNDFYGLVIVD